ncbi:MAG: Rrf2 family transcriptional regulator [Candidatus Omnitrophica bacterium]|nr:Rrf2 family transcriptional regulator [Candidatus Omnitrophota bacterium]
MVKPSRQFSHALRALVDLALHQATGPVTTRSIAKRQKIPARGLEQLFNRLKREGIVEAERGPRGGYRLRKLPREIHLSAVFRCIRSAAKASAVSSYSADPTLKIWRQVEKAVETTLQSATLETVVLQTGEHLPSPNHRYTFHI